MAAPLPEQPRWMSQVTAGESLEGDEEIECDVCVVGTGAGGAVIAKELAARGLAVAILEEGNYHGRADFNGGAIEGLTRFYRERGTVGSIGNTVIPIPMGRMVGGSTAINTATCWRTPEWVLARWAKRRGSTELSRRQARPLFRAGGAGARRPAADARYLGGAARVVARGSDVLGYSHYPVKRNAPDCDGSGVCDFGCPTDAKRSTNVTYVPSALRAGAALYHRRARRGGC